MKRAILTIYLQLLLGPCYSQPTSCTPKLVTDTAEILFDGLVNQMDIVGNRLYAAGEFNAVGKFTGNFVQLNPADGKVVNRRTWPRVTGGYASAVPDGLGGLIVFGDFDRVANYPRTNIAQIDSAGQLTSFSVAVNGVINTAVVDNGIVYIGGNFTMVNGIPRNRAAAIQIGFPALLPWDPDISSVDPLPCRVEALLVANGQVYIGGAFSHVGGVARKNIAAVSLTSGAAGSWSPEAYFSTAPTYGVVTAMHPVNNKLYICGQFDYTGGNMHPDVAAIDMTTGVSTSWKPDPNSIVTSFAHKGDTLYLGGAFFQISGQPRNSFAAYSIATGALLPVIANTSQKVADQVYSIIPVGDTLYLSGSFDSINGKTRKNIAKVNRLTGALLPWESHTHAPVRLLYDNDKLYAGGRFMSANMKARPYFAVLDLDADTILPQTIKVDAPVIRMNIRNDIIYLGGDFTQVGDSARQFNAALERKTLKVTGWYPRANNYIRDVEFYKGRMFAGGHFDSIEGKQRWGLAELNAVSGRLGPWTGIQDAGRVNSIEVYKDSLYVGGVFNNLGGQYRESVGAIDLTTGLATPHMFYDTAWLRIVQCYALTIKGDSMYLGVDKDFESPVPPPPPPFVMPTAINTLNIIDLRNYGVAVPNPPKWDPIAWSNPANLGSLPIITDIYVHSNKDVAVMTGLYLGPFQYYHFSGAGFTPVSFVPYIPKAVNAVAISGNKMYLGGMVQEPHLGGLNALLYELPFVTNSAFAATDTNSLCAGQQATVRAYSNITHNTAYQWYLNGTLVDSTLPYYTFKPSDEDSVSCIVIPPANNCLVTSKDTTNTISFTVIPTVTPEIYIQSIPEEEAGNNVTVRAIVKAAATGYTIQWFNKGLSIGTTTVDSISYIKGPGTDSIYAVITPRTDTCYVTDTSALIIINEKPVGISSLTGDAGIQVYPNPFGDRLYIRGLKERDELTLYDITGRKVLSTTVNNTKDYALPTNYLKAGSYVLKVSDNEGRARQNILLQKE